MKNYLLLFLVLFPALSALIVHIAENRDKRYSKYIMAASCFIEFAAVTAVFPQAREVGMQFYMPDVMGTGLHLKLDMLRYIFVWISCFIWLAAGIYSVWNFKSDSKQARLYVFFLITLSAVVGVFTSENLLNLFTFFEVMALTSYVMVIHNESKEAHKAGRLYLIVSVATGMITLMGIFILYEYTGELNISNLPSHVEEMGRTKYIAAFLMSSSFAAKACMFPLHIWLEETYSKAPYPVTAVFSAVLAKTGVFGIMMIGFMMNWDEVFSIALLAVALSSMIVGGFMALVQVQVKKILAYSSMSQIGYMILSVAAAGLVHSHSHVAVSAGIYHAVNHALFKTLVFMAAGAMISDRGCDDLNDIEFRSRRKALKILFLAGMLSNMGIPGLNGFTSKTMVHHVIANMNNFDGAGVKLISESTFLISAALTVAYSIKLYMGMFSEKHKYYSREDKTDIITIYMPMAAVAAAMIFVSIMPQLVNGIMIEGAGTLFGEVSKDHSSIYTFDSIKSSGVILLLGVFTYRMYALNHLSKDKDNKIQYKDATQGWPTLERDFYAPLVRFSLGISNSVFGFLDGLMSGLTRTICQEFKRFCSMEIRSERFKPDEREDSYYNISEITRKMVFRMESVNYSVFVTASILVFLMFSLID